jgi:hypothetical protein
MRRTFGILLVISLAAAACGFGLANDSGQPIPGPNYWGWVCAYGPVPANVDAGCPPGPCGDGTVPSLVDAGPASGAVCQCDTGMVVSLPNCSPGPCADGTVPTQTDGVCLCDNGAPLPEVDCQVPGPCADGSDPSFATGYEPDDNGELVALDGGTCRCDDGTPVPSADCNPPE